jgi:hypothetical protein
MHNIENNNLSYLSIRIPIEIMAKRRHRINYTEDHRYLIVVDGVLFNIIEIGSYPILPH